MAKNFLQFIDEKRAIVRQQVGDTPQVQPAQTELGQKAGEALRSGTADAASNVDQFAAGITGVNPGQSTAQGLQQRGISNVDPEDPFAAALTGNMSPSDIGKQRVARNLVLRRDLGGSQGDEADPKFDDPSNTERALGVAAQQARVNLRNPKLANFTVGGQRLVDIDPSIMLGENPSTMEYPPELTIDALREMLMRTAATDRLGNPSLVSPFEINQNRTKPLQRILDGDIEKIQMQSQFPWSNARARYVAGKSGTNTTGVDVTGGMRFLPISQIIKMSPYLIDAIQSGEIDLPGVPKMTDEQAEKAKKRIELIARSHNKPTDDMTPEEVEERQRDRRAATRELIAMSNVYDGEVPEEVRKWFYDNVLGGSPGASGSEGGIETSEGGYSKLGTSAAPERNKTVPDGYTESQAKGYNFDNKYFGRYGGLHDDWVAKNPELAELALKYTSQVEQYDQDDSGAYLPRLADMPYDEGMRPGDMVDYLRLTRDRARAKKEESPEFEQLDALVKAIDKNRLDAFIDMSIKSGFRSFYNEDNMISPSENEVEHMMAVSSGGRDHPSNWTASDTNPNIRRTNNSLITMVDDMVQGRRPQQGRATTIDPTEPLNNAEALVRYHNAQSDTVRRQRLNYQLKSMMDKAETPQQRASIQRAIDYIRDTPVEEWETQNFDELPPEAAAPEPAPTPRAPRGRRGQEFQTNSYKYEEMPVLNESFMQFRYSYIKQLVEEKDVWNYQEALEAGYSVAKWYRAALDKKGFEFDANDNVVGIDEARYHIKQAQDKKQEIEGKGKEEKDEKEKEGLRKQYRAWDRLEKSETEYYNKYGDTIKARGAADKRKEEEPDDKPRSYYQRPPITDSKTLEIIKKLRAKGKGKK